MAKGYRVLIDDEPATSEQPVGRVASQVPAFGSERVKNGVDEDIMLSPWNPAEPVILKISLGPM